MPNTASPVPSSRLALVARAAAALLVLAAPGAEAQLTPQVPRGIGQPTPAPGSLKAGKVDLVPFLDESSLVRKSAIQQVRVSPDGRMEARNVVDGTLCAGLAPGATRQVRLPDIRWGVKNEAPRTVAGGAIDVATVDRPFRVLLGGVPNVFETVNRIAPGETKTFVAPRREPRTIQVTQFQVPARVRPNPVPTPRPAGSSGVMVFPPVNTVGGGDSESLKCVADIFVLDPKVYVEVDFDRAITETNETNNRKDF